MTNQSNESIAEHLCCMAYQLYREPPKRVLKDDVQFSMYSYDRIVQQVLHGMILNMLERGLNENEVVEVLQSKQVRWELDNNDDMLIEVGKKLANGWEVL